MWSRKLRSANVIEVLAELVLGKGLPEHIRSDNGLEFCAKAVWARLDRYDVGRLLIESGSLWANGSCESFNGKLRNELLNREIPSPLEEARALVGNWPREFNEGRAHGSLVYIPGASQTRRMIPAVAFPGGAD